MTQYLVRVTGDHQRVLQIANLQMDTTEEVTPIADKMILPFERSHKANETMASILMRPNPTDPQWVLIAWRFAADRQWLYPPMDAESEEPSFA